MTTTATITVAVKSWTETSVEGLPSVVRAEFTAEYAGDAQGSSTCWLLIAYTGGDAEKPESLVGQYTGYEQFTGTLAGRTGSFVLAARGAHVDAVARTDVRVVADSGTGELAGLRGAGSYAAGGMEYMLTLEFDMEFDSAPAE